MKAMSRPRVVVLLGTRPEAIKLAPVAAAITVDGRCAVEVVYSGQQPGLMPGVLAECGFGAHLALPDLPHGLAPDAILPHVGRGVLAYLRAAPPAALVVQGDTATAAAGAIAGAGVRVPVVHVEAGLRSFHFTSPLPEEAYRILITHAASLHCAPTAGNVANLTAEGVPAANIALTGNPIVDVLHGHTAAARLSPALATRLARHGTRRRLLLTLHRRENLGPRQAAYLDAVRDFVLAHPDVVLCAVRHPNPLAGSALDAHLGNHDRIELLPPLGHADFLALLATSALVLSDSGGVQEEIAAVGAPLVVLRAATERPEAIAAGLACLAPDGASLAATLRDLGAPAHWPPPSPATSNPFGAPGAAARIAAAIMALVGP